MHGIYIMAIITTIMCLVVYGAAIYKAGKNSIPREVAWAFLITLPLQPLALYLVRLPFDNWLRTLVEPHGTVHTAIALWYAPLTEEPAKLVPLLFPFIRRAIKPDNVVPYALAMGAGFAIGELWNLAEMITHNPNFANAPFYHFMGFFQERLMVAAGHSAFVALSLRSIQTYLLPGFLLAALAHFSLNFPILLIHIQFMGISKTAWQYIVGIWAQFVCVACVGYLLYLQMGGGFLKKLFAGRARCPSCKEVYARPMISVNLGAKTYERCSCCHKWNMICPSDHVTDEDLQPAPVSP